MNMTQMMMILQLIGASQGRAAGKFMVSHDYGASVAAFGIATAKYNKVAISTKRIL